MNTGNGKFEQDLQKVEDGYRALPGDEPPDLLDQAVLNKARAAVGPRSTRPWSFGWMHATATAAVLVLGLAVVMQQPTELSAPPVTITKPAKTAADMSVAGQIKQDAPALLEERVEEQEPTADEPQRQDADSQKINEESGFRAAKKAEDKRQGLTAAAASIAAPVPASESVMRNNEADQSMGDLQSSFDDELINPDDWISRILDMKNEVIGNEWLQELEQFREIYPDYPLPEELNREMRKEPTGE
jgi:hypothetical protein